MSMLQEETLDSLVTQFNEEGYLVLSRVLSAETIDRVHTFLGQATEESMSRLRSELHLDTNDELVDHINQVVGTPEFAGLDKFTRDVMTGHYPLDVRLAKELWAIAQDPGLRRTLKTLLSSEKLYLHMPPTARFVLPNNAPAGVPAHQDVVYNEHMSGFITVWVTFVEITDECGGVAVYPRSGQVKQAVTQSEGKFWYDSAPTEGLEKLHVKCKPRDILIMNNYVIHESMPNVSDTTRISVDLRFFGESGSSKKHYLDMQEWYVVDPSSK